MIKSMTGYGRELVDLPDKHFLIEVKSLNSKQLDIHLRIPAYYKEKEPEIRQMVSNILERGKIEIHINIENTGHESAYDLNKALIGKYYDELSMLSKDLDEDTDQLIPAILRFPDVLKTESLELGKEEWEKLVSSINISLKKLDRFRIDEGVKLEEDIRKRIDNILVLHKEMHEFEAERIQNIKSRLRLKLDEIKELVNVDENRFEQELIYYLEKYDITEENVRLDRHCNYFKETLVTGGSIGRKLAFISQEIGREINTIGSKANDAEIQKRVILMKDELEKIKEQLFNIL